MIEPDLILKATLFDAAVYRVDQTDDRGLLSNPWDARIAKAVQPDDGDIPDVVGRLFANAERNALGQREGVADEAWDAVLTKTTVSADPETLPERSQARLEKTYATINRIFNGHEAEAAEAREIAKKLLIATRAEIMAAA